MKLVSGIIIILFGAAITTITALSMSAISTNGVLQEGGTYFMISRSLGPEFGACIGVIYSIALSAACAMHMVGFCEMLQILMKSFNVVILDGKLQDMRLLGIGLTITLLCATLGGCRSRVQVNQQIKYLFLSRVHTYTMLCCVKKKLSVFNYCYCIVSSGLPCCLLILCMKHYTSWCSVNPVLFTISIGIYYLLCLDSRSCSSTNGCSHFGCICRSYLWTKK